MPEIIIAQNSPRYFELWNRTEKGGAVKQNSQETARLFFEPRERKGELPILVEDPFTRIKYIM